MSSKTTFVIILSMIENRESVNTVIKILWKRVETEAKVVVIDGKGLCSTGKFVEARTMHYKFSVNISPVTV